LEHVLSIYLEDNSASWKLNENCEYTRSLQREDGFNSQHYFLKELTTFKSIPAKLKTL
jgi:hypothetical protein